MKLVFVFFLYLVFKIYDLSHCHLLNSSKVLLLNFILVFESVTYLAMRTPIFSKSRNGRLSWFVKMCSTIVSLHQERGIRCDLICVLEI